MKIPKHNHLVVVDSFIKSEVEEIRTLEIDGTPYFVASGIAKVLKYAKSNNTVSSRCRSTLKRGIATKQGNVTFHS